jgi:hypothetical protein
MTGNARVRTTGNARVRTTGNARVRTTGNARVLILIRSGGHDPLSASRSRGDGD